MEGLVQLEQNSLGALKPEGRLGAHCGAHNSAKHVVAKIEVSIACSS